MKNKLIKSKIEQLKKGNKTIHQNIKMANTLLVMDQVSSKTSYRLNDDFGYIQLFH